MKGFRHDEKALTAIEFIGLIQLIEQKHSFGKPGHANWVKYIRPSFDMRDGKCFHIKLDDKVFDSSECEGRMIDEITEWLGRGRDIIH